MKNTMNTPMERTPGGLLGIDHEIESQARFVYDRRGPRVSPAIEIQHWMKKFNEVYTEQCKKFDPDHKTKMSRLDWGSIGRDLLRGTPSLLGLGEMMCQRLPIFGTWILARGFDVVVTVGGV